MLKNKFRRKFLFFVILLALIFASACDPSTLPQTPEETKEPTPEPTPTIENLEWFDDSPINPNAFLFDGCTSFVFGEAGRLVCIPYGWDWNSLEFTNTSPPPDNMRIVREVSDDVEDNAYLEMRIDWLNQSHLCFAQYESLLKEHKPNGQKINYVFKVRVELVTNQPPDLPSVPSANLVILTDDSKSYMSPYEIIYGGVQDFIWVIDPTNDYGVHYQFCFNFYGIRDGDLRIYTMAVFEAGDHWGKNVEVEL